MVVHQIQYHDLDYFEGLLSRHRVVVVEGYSAECAVCQSMAHVTDRLSERHRNIYFISIDWSPRDLLSHALGITTVPSYLIFKDSVRVARIVGPHAGPLRSAVETIAEPLSPVTDTADDSSSLTSSQLGDDLIPAAEWNRLQQLHREQQEQLREQFQYLQRTNQRDGRPGSADNRSATSNVSQLSLASHLSLSSQSS